MGQGLLKGTTSVGLQFATQGLDPTVGGLVSSVGAGAIDGLISPADPNRPLGDRKGIFGGITDTLRNAVGGFTDIGLIKAGDPVGNAQRLAQLNDFSSIIREQGLGAAVETYAAGLLNRSAVESLYNAGISLDRNHAIQAAINAQMRNPLLVELEGKQAIQIDLGGNNYLWVDPTSHALMSSLQGQDYIRYGKVLVDPNTRTLGIPDATIKRTFKGPDGVTVTAQFLEEISAGGVVSFKLYDKASNLWTIDRNSLREIRLSADGTIRDGTLTFPATGEKVTFLSDGSFKIQKPVQVVKEQPDGTYVSVGQTTVEETRNPGGKLVALVAQAIGDMDKLGLLSVQTGQAENGVAFVDQQGRIQMAYKGNFIVIGHSTKFLELADTAVSFYPAGAPIPTANFRPVWLKDQAVSTVQNPDKKIEMGDEFNRAQQFILDSGAVTPGQISAEFILTPKVSYSQKVASGVTRTSSFDLRVLSPDSLGSNSSVSWGPLQGFTGSRKATLWTSGQGQVSSAVFEEASYNITEEKPVSFGTGFKTDIRLSDNASDPSQLGLQIKWVESDAPQKMTFIVQTSVTTNRNSVGEATGNLTKASAYEKFSFDNSDATVPAELKETADSLKKIFDRTFQVPAGAPPLPIHLSTLRDVIQLPQAYQQNSTLRSMAISYSIDKLRSYAQSRGLTLKVLE